jgi:hypothetical protein
VAEVLAMALWVILFLYAFCFCALTFFP